jgi:hypothetical protein
MEHIGAEARNSEEIAAVYAGRAKNKNEWDAGKMWWTGASGV